MSDVDTVAEAMWLTHTGDFPAWAELSEDDRSLYRALAQAAIDALQLKEEKRNIRSICDMADTVGIDKRRWVTPWVRVEGVTP